jgi:hypothetical protein
MDINGNFITGTVKLTQYGQFINRFKGREQTTTKFSWTKKASDSSPVYVRIAH